jgi:hypothetical protein
MLTLHGVVRGEYFMPSGIVNVVREPSSGRKFTISGMPAHCTVANSSATGEGENGRSREAAKNTARCLCVKPENSFDRSVSFLFGREISMILKSFW